MISLYLSHIPIFFHIHIFHIFMYRYFYRFRLLPCHLCFFFIFSFYGMKAGCIFLVIFWCRCCGCFRSVLRLVLRFVIRFVPFLVPSLVPPFGPFSRFVHRPVLRSALLFVFSVWACRGGAVCGSRRFCQLVFPCRLVLSRRCCCSLSCSSRLACRVAACLVSGRGSVAVRGCWVWAVSWWRGDVRVVRLGVRCGMWGETYGEMRSGTHR